MKAHDVEEVLLPNIGPFEIKLDMSIYCNDDDKVGLVKFDIKALETEFTDSHVCSTIDYKENKNEIISTLYGRLATAILLNMYDFVTVD